MPIISVRDREYDRGNRNANKKTKKKITTHKTKTEKSKWGQKP